MLHCYLLSRTKTVVDGNVGRDNLTKSPLLSPRPGNSDYFHNSTHNKMRPGGSSGQSSSSSSSFEKTPREPQEYPLEILDHDSDSSNFVAVPRESFDSARLGDEEHSSEPLLPTSVQLPRPELKREERFQCTTSGVINWAKGPPQPRKYQITPWLQRWQTAPGRLIDRYCPSKRAKTGLLLSVVIVWFVIFLSVIHKSVNGIDVPGYGKPVKLACHDRLW